jgi:hypothetical protein
MQPFVSECWAVIWWYCFGGVSVASPGGFYRESNIVSQKETAPNARRG